MVIQQKRINDTGEVQTNLPAHRPLLGGVSLGVAVLMAVGCDVGLKALVITWQAEPLPPINAGPAHLAMSFHAINGSRC